MYPSYVLLALAFLAIVCFVIGSSRGRAMVQAGGANVHSRPGYHGSYLAIMAALIPAVVLCLWTFASPIVTNSLVISGLPEAIRAQPTEQRTLVIGQIEAVSDGLTRLTPDELKSIERARLGLSTMESASEIFTNKGIVLGSAPEPYVVSAAYDLLEYSNISRWLMTGLVALFAVAGIAYGYRRILPRMRARNTVEMVMMVGLIAASIVAILTTFGIVMSMLSETVRFFQSVSPVDFLTGTVWDPRFTAVGRSGGGEGQFGLLPLLWGTLFISFVAMLVAVPIGLYAAIYMSEYATSRVRGIVKPLLEVLAGIPTIVYGFFALVTFGPFVRDAGNLIGISISASSVLTAGVVMGVMIIPFVSSLSDDIISSVPQSLREGSLGLGATKSETIKRVVLPAALPGIVGAVLLAASRAIGETMIVVLAAGIAANLTLNPFEPVTTITVKIVSQLTGDLEFNSPQTLVAFALGLTLFIITLGLNIYALYIVRKYKEQYE